MSFYGLVLSIVMLLLIFYLALLANEVSRLNVLEGAYAGLVMILSNTHLNSLPPI